MDKLLLIDDEPDILRVLSMSLKADGYDVVSAPNGTEGIAAFEKEKPEIVITDIKMPGMDGIEVLKKIKDLDIDTEVIIITGHGDIENAIEALKHGASDFINKPVRDEALSIALRRAREKFDIRQQLKEYTTDLERKVDEATREVRRRSNFQINLIRSSNDGIVATDKDLKIVIYNPTARQIFGYTPAETINKMQAGDLFPAELVADLQAALQGEHKIKNLENHRTLYDSIALGVAVVPILLWFFTFITAPLSLILVIRYWKAPSSIIPRTKIRFIMAFIIGFLQITGWAIGIFALIT